MSDYTPSAVQVRDAATGFTAWEPEEFDRWLAEHEEQVRAEERERIARRLSVEHAKPARNIKTRYGQGQIDAYAHAARIARRKDTE